MEKTVRVELTADEILALIKLVKTRLEYLASQPQTPERDKEVKALYGYVSKTSPQVSAHAQTEMHEDKAQQN